MLPENPSSVPSPLKQHMHAFLRTSNQLDLSRSLTFARAGLCDARAPRI